MFTFGGMRSMWLITMFDLPTDTKRARKAYANFRKDLQKDGFMMLQYSVYARHCASDENATVHESRVRTALPDDGEVRIVKITDKQFGRMQVFLGRERCPTEDAPEQLSFF
jgi:CRISPR-associated protein Cas2